jgi:hypothetical protein
MKTFAYLTSAGQPNNGRRRAIKLCGLVCSVLCHSAAWADQKYPEIAISSEPVVVFKRQIQHCDDLDIPDAPLRAFRTYDGSVVAFSTHYRNRRLLGASLANLVHDCRVVYEGNHDQDPAAFNDRTWIAATWTNDGKVVTALGHNEYQAERFPGRCQFTTYRQCWYNSIVLLRSNDAGKTFARADFKGATPVPLVASPEPSEADQGHPRGYFNPSNIISFEGYYYSLVAQTGIGSQPPGRCLFRSQDPSSLSGWTFHDGRSFVPSAGSAYDGKPSHPPCQAVAGLHGTLGSVAKIKGSNLFAAFAIGDIPSSRDGGTVEVSFSTDLLHWGGTKVITTLSSFWSKACTNDARYNYVSVLDDADASHNFETIGGSPWLFMVRGHCNVTMDRDLVRIGLSVRSGAMP